MNHHTIGSEKTPYIHKVFLLRRSFCAKLRDYVNFVTINLSTAAFEPLVRPKSNQKHITHKKILKTLININRGSPAMVYLPDVNCPLTPTAGGSTRSPWNGFVTSLSRSEINPRTLVTFPMWRAWTFINQSEPYRVTEPFIAVVAQLILESAAEGELFT